MMLNEGDDMQPAKWRPDCPATIALLIVTVLAFVGQKFLERFHPDFDSEAWFALSLDGLRKGYVWQVVTFQLMHGGWWHILLNAWVMFVFGRVVEISLGAKRMLWLYFVSGIAGGLTQMLGVMFFPGLFGNVLVVGASAGAFGLVAAFAVMYPTHKLMLLLFFVIPLRMKARTLTRFFIIIALFGILMPKLTGLFLMVIGYFCRYFPGLMMHCLVYYMQAYEMSKNVAHAAHLGGIVAGGLIAKRWMSAYSSSAPSIEVEAKSALNATPAPD